MAGDIEEPFSLSFQADSIHSGSISFGRFETESLSWERRSSFSHNRYLEDVEKYTKPGSVTEKAAFLEAHFRRKSLQRQSSSESQVDTKSQPSYQNQDSCQFDESSEGVYYDQHVNQHSESGEYSVDVHVVSHFDESHEDSRSPGVCEDRGEFEEEDDASSHSAAQFGPATENSEELLQKVVTCYDSEEKFKSEDEAVRALTDDIVHVDVEVEIIPNGQVMEVPKGEEPRHCTKSRAEEETRQLEPALERIESEICIRSCNDKEKFRSESVSNNGLVDIIEHEVEVEMISNEQASEVQTKECVSDCTQTKTTISASKSPQTRTSKSMAEEKTQKTRVPGLKSRAQSSTSLTSRPELKKGTAQISGWREKQTPLRMRTQKPMPQLNGTSAQSSLGMPKKENPRSLKGKPSHENRSEKELKPKRVSLQPSTPERTEFRRHSSSTAGTKNTTSANKEIKRCALNSSFRSERGEKPKGIKQRALTSSFRSERGEKIRSERKVTDTTKQAKQLAFKAKPLPSFYHQTPPPQGLSGNKVISRSSRPPTKSSGIGNQPSLSSIQSSKTGRIQPMSPSKPEGPCASLGGRYSGVNANSGAMNSSNTRNHPAKVSRTKMGS